MKVTTKGRMVTVMGLVTIASTLAIFMIFTTGPKLARLRGSYHRAT